MERPSLVSALFLVASLLPWLAPAASWAQQDQAADETPEAPPETPQEVRDETFPRLDIYFPEGELDLRLSRLIKNAFFEGQIKYSFIEGDISAFLRYRYYGYRTIYQLGVFDSVEFENIEELDNDFERVRGFLFFLQWPHSYHYRTFLLVEHDRLSSSKEELRFDTGRKNTFFRLGFQRGTPDDERSSSIVGETRARIDQLFSAHRKIGPSQIGLTAALTYSAEFLGDFDYVKLEVETLKRFDLSRRVFAIGRLGGGTFLAKSEIREGPDIDDEERYAIPRDELFRLDGRANLKGLGERVRGTEELRATGEVFFPWFLDRSHRFLWVDWENFYWILYGGVGAAGFERDALTDLDNYFPDLGFGFEASFRLKSYRFFLSGLLAHALRGEGDLEGYLTIKSYH